MTHACPPPRHAALLVLALLLWAGTAMTVDAAQLKKVLLVHSYGRSTAPFDAFVTSFRTELLSARPEGVAFYDYSLETGRPASGTENDEAVVRVLRSRFAESKLDLIVVVGAPAMRFYLDHRDALLDDVPILVIADQRFAAAAKLRPGDAIVGIKTAATQVVGDILELLPETRTVAVIFGSTAGERARAAEFRQWFASLEDRVRFVWLEGLALSELRQRVASLPADAVALYGLFQMDAAGVLYEQDYAINEIRRASSVPLFGFFESQIGQGMVGGRLTSTAEQGVVAARTAGRMLDGARAEPPIYVGPTFAQYDARELERWHIDEKRLPAGSVVRYRPASIWEQHKLAILAGIALLLFQASLISGLVLQRARRWRAERESKALTSRVFTAHEDERRRLARELHDDVTQRLARIAIDVARMSSPQSTGTPLSVHGELVRLSEDVHALSYRLHPSILDDLGLAEALKAECEQVARREPVRVAVEITQVPEAIPGDVALCIFRVAQEALRNVARHAKATVAIVTLAIRDGGLLLAVRDDGIGFDVGARQAHPSLGRAGMDERVRLLGGNFEIESRAGQGTIVSAWVPLEARPA